MEEVPADVPADDPMLEEDQPGAPGGASIADYMPLDAEERLRSPEEVITMKQIFHSLLMDYLTVCFKEGTMRCMVGFLQDATPTALLVSTICSGIDAGRDLKAQGGKRRLN